MSPKIDRLPQARIRVPVDEFFAMGCSSSLTRHDTEWEFLSVSRDRLSGAIQRSLLRPPKWQLTQFAPAGDTVDMFYGERRTDTFGFVDRITLRVSYDAPVAGRSTVVAVSQCTLKGNKFDWGQNKRNLTQLHAAIQKELTTKAFAFATPTSDFGGEETPSADVLGRSLMTASDKRL